MRTVVALVLLALLCGCGLKGNLYLPTNKPAAAVPAPAPAEPPSGSDEDDGKNPGKPAPQPQ